MPSRLTLRVFSNAHAAAELTRLLALDPSHSHDRGSPRIPEHPEAGAFDSTGWFRDAGRGDFAWQLEQVLALVEPRREAIEALGDEVQIDLSCGLFARGGVETFALDAPLVTRLAAAGLPLTLALHPQAAPKQAIHGASLFDAAKWNRKWRSAAVEAEGARTESPLDASLPFEAHLARLLREPLPERATVELTCAAANGQDRVTVGAGVLARIAEKSGRIAIVLAPPPLGAASA